MWKSSARYNSRRALASRSTGWPCCCGRRRSMLGRSRPRYGGQGSRRGSCVALGPRTRRVAHSSRCSPAPPSSSRPVASPSYLSLGQVPQPDEQGAPPTDRARWVPPSEVDEVLPAPPLQPSLFDVQLSTSEIGPDADDRPVVEGGLRTPWRWDRLLVESAVIGGHDRWARRLSGLAHELRLRLEGVCQRRPAVVPGPAARE